MPEWEVTATTVYCEAVDDEVTLLVSRDGPPRCTGQKKYTSPDKETTRSLKKKGRQLRKPLGCDATGCSRITRYRDRLLGSRNEAR
ncbi:MAG TPA: hypothetical protein VJ377_03960 [Dehalococcoidales bacterium]|nr:MAG: hypothetical protein A2Z05_03545 [Chloroflexi bacterium RBG_16_60_22]HJX12665.1 hypothetical protein [Dehalococcoidales bacterium]